LTERQQPFLDVKLVSGLEKTARQQRRCGSQTELGQRCNIQEPGVLGLQRNSTSGDQVLHEAGEKEMVSGPKKNKEMVPVFFSFFYSKGIFKSILKTI